MKGDGANRAGQRWRHVMMTAASALRGERRQVFNAVAIMYSVGCLHQDKEKEEEKEQERHTHN